MAFFDADIGVRLIFTVTDQDGNAVDLTNYVVEIIVYPDTGPTFTCVVDPDQVTYTGRCWYIVQTGDFVKGIHSAQLRCSQSGNQFHSDIFKLKSMNALVPG